MNAWNVVITKYTTLSVCLDCPTGNVISFWK